MSQHSSPLVRLGQTLPQASLAMPLTSISDKINTVSPFLLRRSPQPDLSSNLSSKIAVAVKSPQYKKQNNHNISVCSNLSNINSNYPSYPMNSLQKQKLLEIIQKQQREQNEFERISPELPSISMFSGIVAAKFNDKNSPKLVNATSQNQDESPRNEFTINSQKQSMHYPPQQKKLLQLLNTAASTPKIRSSFIGSRAREVEKVGQTVKLSQQSNYSECIRCENGMIKDKQFTSSISSTSTQSSSHFSLSYSHLLSVSEQHFIEEIEIAAETWQTEVVHHNNSNINQSIPSTLDLTLPNKQLKSIALSKLPSNHFSSQDISSNELSQIKSKNEQQQQSSWLRVSPKKQCWVKEILQEKLEHCEDSLATTGCLSAESTSTSQSLSQILQEIIIASPQNNDRNPSIDNENKINHILLTCDSHNLDSSCEDNRELFKEVSLLCQ